jgi:hypothetical protein
MGFVLVASVLGFIVLPIILLPFALIGWLYAVIGPEQKEKP